MTPDPSDLALAARSEPAAGPRPGGRWPPRAVWRRVWRSWIGRRWVISRGLTVFLLVPELFQVFGDVIHYFHGVNGLFAGGPAGAALPEYPAPSLVVFALPRLVTGGHQVPYVPLFCALVLALDALFTLRLWRATTWRPQSGTVPPPGLTLWLWLPPALGPLTVCRLDLVPAVLAGGALLVAARRPGRPGQPERPGRPALAGMMAALGAGLKLWPAALVPALWLRRDGRWRMLAAFAVTAGAIVLATLALVGRDRLVSPLTWQSDRSLQLESYAALPLLVAGAVSPGTWHAAYTRFFAFEVTGPGVGVMLTVASAATVAAVAVLAALWLRAAWRRDVTPLAAGWLATAAVLLMVVTDKTLSPQYLLWPGALLAATGVTAVDPALARAGRLLLVSAVLTQAFYPTMYGLLIDLNPLPVALLVARDVLLLRLTWLAVRRFWALTAAAPPPGDPEPA